MISWSSPSFLLPAFQASPNPNQQPAVNCTTLDFTGCASCLRCQQFKVVATKISTKNVFVLVFIFFCCCLFFHASLKSPCLYTLTCRQVDGIAKKKLCSAELSLLHTLSLHSTVCTHTNWKAWSAKHSSSMSGICCLMSPSIKPSGRDESSNSVHQARLLYSNSH